MLHDLMHINALTFRRERLYLPCPTRAINAISSKLIVAR